MKGKKDAGNQRSEPGKGASPAKGSIRAAPEPGVESRRETPPGEYALSTGCPPLAG
ncbi:MAG: hypothetical protein AB1523_00370 [Bacillota bacterium]